MDNSHGGPDFHETFILENEVYYKRANANLYFGHFVESPRQLELVDDGVKFSSVVAASLWYYVNVVSEQNCLVSVSLAYLNNPARRLENVVLECKGANQNGFVDAFKPAEGWNERARLAHFWGPQYQGAGWREWFKVRITRVQRSRGGYDYP